MQGLEALASLVRASGDKWWQGSRLRLLEVVADGAGTPLEAWCARCSVVACGALVPAALECRGATGPHVAGWWRTAPARALRPGAQMSFAVVWASLGVRCHAGKDEGGRAQQRRRIN